MFQYITFDLIINTIMVFFVFWYTYEVCSIRANNVYVRKIMYTSFLVTLLGLRSLLDSPVQPPIKNNRPSTHLQIRETLLHGHIRLNAIDKYLTTRVLFYSFAG